MDGSTTGRGSRPKTSDLFRSAEEGERGAVRPHRVTASATQKKPLPSSFLALAAAAHRIADELTTDELRQHPAARFLFQARNGRLDQNGLARQTATIPTPYPWSHLSGTGPRIHIRRAKPCPP
ncbi:hypothetical protein GCM10023196_002120 [Actinoallomurus vinaceus]|uniref:Uncharacterized protein n=1 Tax=Actinoallomurus vinaceus TaxID=1080074 RepID=A0ABP8U319_9ACTN